MILRNTGDSEALQALMAQVMDAADDSYSFFGRRAMKREDDGLVPIGEALADLPGPVKALRKTPPPARRGFTLADQVNQ